jgi:hypothetical protein
VNLTPFLLEETMSARFGDQPAVVAWSQVWLGGLLVALGDAAFATTFWFTWDVPGVTQMFQSIAVGVLGPASFAGGVPAAVLGAALHLVMATLFVAAYVLVSRRTPFLLQRPLAYGVPYGVVMYAVMNFVVMPLSRVGRSPSLANPERIAVVVAAHMVFGVICVLFARRALRR